MKSIFKIIMVCLMIFLNGCINVYKTTYVEVDCDDVNVETDIEGNIEN